MGEDRQTDRPTRQAHPARRNNRFSTPVLYVALTAFTLGLCGTVVGLIKAFGAVGGESVDPSQKARILAEGISEAMNCTAAGLFVALMAAGVIVLIIRWRDGVPTKPGDGKARVAADDADAYRGTPEPTDARRAALERREYELAWERLDTGVRGWPWILGVGVIAGFAITAGGVIVPIALLAAWWLGSIGTIRCPRCKGRYWTLWRPSLAKCSSCGLERGTMPSAATPGQDNDPN